MKREIDILIEKAKKEEKYFKSYLDYVKKIKKEAQKLLGRVKIFVFGSILRKNEVAQDIDILIISPKFEVSEKKNEIRLKIQKKIGPDTPFEIHTITPKEYKEWYSHFIKEKIRV